MKKFEITKEQLMNLNEETNIVTSEKLTKWFPEAFQSELEVGKWYKRKAELLVWNDGKETYGFNSSGMYKDYMLCSNISNPISATDKEVETALIAEAKRIGFKDGAKIRHILYDMSFSESLLIINNFNLTYDPNDNSLDYKAEDGQIFRLFKDGKWAEIISEPIEVTLEQIAEKFNVNVEQLKIKK